MKNFRRQGIKIGMILLLCAMLLPGWCVQAQAAGRGLSKKSISLIVGKSTTLTLKKGKGKVSWKSSDKKIVALKKISKYKYKLTAKKAGSAKIIVKNKGKTYVCKVKVTRPLTVKNVNLAYPSKSGRLKVSGTKLVDEKGKAVQLKGISTHGLSWYPKYVNRACFEQLRYRWGVNAIRLAMYTAEYNGYCTGSSSNRTTLKKKIDEGVKYATANDMYVIIDWHVLNDQNPNKYKSQAVSFFKAMAKKYKNNKNVIYEICNEPNGSVTWAQVKSYAQTVIKAIRTYDSKAIIIVGTPTWSQDVDKAAASPIKGYKNIMYALHFYAATHKDDLRNKMIKAIQKGLPVFVSEYGICDASGNGSIDKSSANKWIKTLDQYGISYMAWSLSNKGETASILKSSCTKLSGFSYSDLSASGKWLYTMLTTGAKSKGVDLTKTLTQAGTSGQSGNSGEAGGASGSSSAQTSGSAYTTYTAPAGISGKVSSGGIVCTINSTNTWKSGDKAYYQLSITLENTSEVEISDWKVTIPFSDTISLDQGWCASFSTQDSSLLIEPADYNSAIAAGESVTNIGCIVTADATKGELKIGKK